MDTHHSAAELIEDHALERVPDADRHGWLDLTWNTVGIVTTLASMFAGAMCAYIAGLGIAIAAGAAVAVLGAALGWATGHIAHVSGYSSTVMSRHYGFGTRGSLAASVVYGVMMVGFIGLENILLYKGFLFYLDAPDTLANRCLGYGGLTLAWIALTAFGFAAVTRVSAVLLIGFLLAVAWMLVVIVGQSPHTVAELLTFGSQFPPERLAGLGALTPAGKFFACVNLLMGSAGALALLDADLGRYARRSRDVAIAAGLGNFFLDIVMIVLGGVIVFAGMPALVDYYVNVGGRTPEQAASAALESPDAIAAAFIVFGGLAGAFLMVAAQAKAQVLNTYAAALSLTNLADAVAGWRPGRLFWVVGANVLALAFLYDEVLVWYFEFLVSLGVLTTGMASIMVADYYLVRRGQPGGDRGAPPEAVNRAGLVSLAVGFVLARYVLHDVIRIEAATAIGVSLTLYPVLRRHVFRPVPG